MAEKTVKTDSIEQTATLFGGFDANAKRIEDSFNVTLRTRDSESAGGSVIAVTGESDRDVCQAAEALTYLQRIASLNGHLTGQNVDYVISMVRDGKSSELSGIDGDCICITTRGKPIKAKTVGQSRYVDLIKKNTIVMGIGPAGTGKTHLAMAFGYECCQKMMKAYFI
jgi:phosphate starvation-inducible PhoH-like protein